MTDPDTPRHVEIRDGDHTIATAEVMTCEEATGTARIWLRAVPGHVPPGRRAILVDAVMDRPEVQASARLEATVLLGDTELLERLRQRTHGAVTRPAGCTALLDADIPPPGRPGAGQIAAYCAGHRAGAARGALARRQQRERDGRPDEHQRRRGSGQGGPEADLLQPGIDDVPEPGPASRARMTSPVIPAFHGTG